jgi:selenocysteine lyase/cysteine desulfurase
VSETLINALRSDWSAQQRYMNFGTFGPSTHAVLRAECEARLAMNRDFAGFFEQHLRGPLCRERMDQIATFMGADLDDIAWLSGTTEALNLVARGLALDPGDEVLTTQAEHPAAVYPWLLRARDDTITLRQIPFPAGQLTDHELVEMFYRALTPATRVLAFSHVNYTDGALLPVADICAMARSAGVLTVVDGAQAVGMLDFSVRELGCDIYATSLHKWTAGIYGSGVICVRQALQDRLTPLMVEMPDGWRDKTRFGEPTAHERIEFRRGWPQAMQRYSTLFHYAGPILLGTLAAIEQIQAIGLANVEARVRSLAARLRSGLADISGVRVLTPSGRGVGITSFAVDGIEPLVLYRWLAAEHGIMTRIVDHAPVGFVANRVCTHIFNDDQDVDELLSAVAQAADGGLTAGPLADA